MREPTDIAAGIEDLERRIRERAETRLEMLIKFNPSVAWVAGMQKAYHADPPDTRAAALSRAMAARPEVRARSDPASWNDSGIVA